MDKVILVFSFPNHGELNHDQGSARRSILESQLSVEKFASKSKKIAEGVLLIQLPDDLSHFAKIVYLCNEVGFPYKVLYLKEDQDFVDYPLKTDEK